MRVIDVHVHSGEWIYEVYRNKGLYCYSYTQNYSDCVDVALFMPAEDKDNRRLEKEIHNNRNNSKMQLFKLSWVDPFKNSYIDKEAVGLKIHGGIDRAMGGTTNPGYDKYYMYAIDNNLPILVHCGGWSKTSNAKLLALTAEMFPQLTFIAAHCGGKNDSDKIEAIDILAPYDNIMIDTSATKYTEVLKYASSVLGSERILFGSDWPIMCPPASIEVVKDAFRDNEAQMEEVFHLNAERVFKI